jgi:hypothetical protein
VDLKFTFIIIVHIRVMQQWYASSISYKEEEEDVILKFNSKGIYSVQSLYAIINDGGVGHVYTSVMWKIVVPRQLHIFLWLLANNKTLTRDNLAKKEKSGGWVLLIL